MQIPIIKGSTEPSLSILNETQDIQSQTHLLEEIRLQISSCYKGRMQINCPNMIWQNDRHESSVIMLRTSTVFGFSNVSWWNAINQHLLDQAAWGNYLCQHVHNFPTSNYSNTSDLSLGSESLLYFPPSKSHLTSSMTCDLDKIKLQDESSKTSSPFSIADGCDIDFSIKSLDSTSNEKYKNTSPFGTFRRNAKRLVVKPQTNLYESVRIDGFDDQCTHSSHFSPSNYSTLTKSTPTTPKAMSAGVTAFPCLNDNELDNLLLKYTHSSDALASPSSPRSKSLFSSLSRKSRSKK